MPNHCHNRVRFYSGGDTAAIEKLHKIFSKALDENDELKERTCLLYTSDAADE